MLIIAFVLCPGLRRHTEIHCFNMVLDICIIKVLRFLFGSVYVVLLVLYSRMLNFNIIFVMLFSWIIICQLCVCVRFVDFY